MKISPQKQTREFDDSGSVLTPNLWILSNKSSYLDRKNGVQPGMWALRKGKGGMSFLPEEFDGIVISYVPYKLAFSETGEQSRKGEPPFCSSILEDTSLRWNATQESYIQGPSCVGNLELGIPPCPFYEEGKNTKVCKKGMLVYVVFKDGTYARLHLKHQRDIDNLEDTLKELEEGTPIKFGYTQNGQFFNPVFEVSHNSNDFAHLDLKEIEAKIDKEIEATARSQRGE